MNHAEKYVIYTPANSLRHPLILFKQMWSDLIASFEPAYRLLTRDIKAEYRQSLLGILWAFIAPVVASAAFILANSAELINVGDIGLPYPAYVMLSMTLWTIFIGSLQAPLNALHAQSYLMTRIKFTFETAILNNIGYVIYNSSIKALLIVGLFIFFRLELHWTIILVPFAILLLIMFGMLIGLLITPISALYNDFGRILQMSIQFLMFVTPVIYAVPSTGLISILMKWNPITYLLVTVRELATIGIISYPLGFFVVSIVTFIMLPIGWLILRLSMPFIIERLN